MKTKHAEIRAHQRGVSLSTEILLQAYGETRLAPKGCEIRFFGKNSLKEITSVFGHSFVAKHHEQFKSYLIESADDQVIITVGKLYQKQRLTNSKIHRLHH